MENKSALNFLASFFKLFKARIKQYTFIDDKAIGTVEWDNEIDKQDFISYFDFDKSILTNAELVCTFINDNNLNNGDQISVSEERLLTKLIDAGWHKNDAEKAIDFLCNFDVKMLDDGQETDSFYLHF